MMGIPFCLQASGFCKIKQILADSLLVTGLSRNSDNCFGTADAILFRNNFLRIHDLKTGKIPAHMEQLEIYAALFCLEYKVKPGDIEMELRIYQNNEILYHNPTAEDIVPIMDRIITFDKVIKKIREQEG